MNKEKLQSALEAIGKGGINVAGDLVLEKHVDYEVNNVEAGGIGIQINNGRNTAPATETDEPTMPQELQSNRARGMLDRAVEQGILNADYQPASDTLKWQLACLADCMGEELNIKNKWVVFGSLWGNGDNLRKYKKDKQGMTDYNNFEKKVKRSIV